MYVEYGIPLSEGLNHVNSRAGYLTDIWSCIGLCFFIKDSPC